MWSIGKGILVLLDGLFDVINQIWRFDFFNNEFVVNIFNGAIIIACSWLGLKVVIELIMNFIVKDESRNVSVSSIYRNIVLAIVIMFLIGPIFDFGYNVSTKLTDAVISSSKMSESSSAENSISTAIVRSMIYENETQADDITYLVNNWKTIDINDSEGGFAGFGDVYKYSLNFFMLIVIAIVTVFLLFFIAIQMAKRVMEIALYKILGPFCATSLTSGSRSFELWCKSSMGAFLITVVQFIGIGLLLNLFGTAFESAGLIGGIFLVIGALLFIISTPTLVSTLLNQQSSLASSLADMQSLVAVGGATATGLGIAKAGISGALGVGASVIGGGVNMSKKSFSSIQNLTTKNSKLTEDQKASINEDLQHFNSYSAQQKTWDYMNQNSNGKYNRPKTGYYKDMQSSLKSPSSVHFNAIRGKYNSDKKE